MYDDGVYMMKENDVDFLFVFCDMMLEFGVYILLVISILNNWNVKDVKF